MSKWCGTTLRTQKKAPMLSAISRKRLKSMARLYDEAPATMSLGLCSACKNDDVNERD